MREGNEEIIDLRYRPAQNHVSPLEVIELAELRARKVQHSIYQPKRLSFHALIFVTEGIGAHWIDFQRIPLSEGDILHICPSQVHSFDRESPDQAWLVTFLAAAAPYLTDLQRISLRTDSPICPSPRDFGKLTDLIRYAFGLQSSKGSLDLAAMAPGLIGALLCGVGSIVSNPSGVMEVDGRMRELVYRFEQLADENCAASRDVLWYASRLGVSGRTLARAFQQVRSCRTKEVLDRRLALEAQRRLVLTAQTIDEISASLGFTEATNFVKFFKRLTGATPGAFRANPVTHQGFC